MAKPDPFLDSMTFASGSTGRGGCDCDECGGFSLIPPSITEAIREHKRLKLMTLPVRRTQDRTLVTREEGMSVYQLTMPLDADPLVEFGSSHRIIFVKTLKKGPVLKGSGKGIIGSGTEEKSRKVVPWLEGKAYLIPCNGGKALGWIYTESDSDEIKAHAILYTIKVPVSVLEEEEEEHEEEEIRWVQKVLKICNRTLSARKDREQISDKETYTSIPLAEIDSSTIRELLLSLVAQ